MRSTKILFLAFSALLLLGAGCAANKPTVSPANKAIETEGLKQAAMVSIQPNGFSPTAVIVRRGQAVTWINEDSGADHWIASNPHPAHTDYPGFDAKGPIKPGGSWSFVFSRAGVWRYHDHLNPAHQGSVTVAE